jgi:acetyltransferase-like isoleucine patch superfamily enzyme
MNLFRKIRLIIRSEIVKKKFSKSKIYSGAKVDNNSILNKNSVIFNDVVLNNSNIGAYSYIQARSIVSNTSIGKFCSIAGDVFIGLPQHATAFVSTHPIFYLNNTPLPKIFSSVDFFETDKRTYIDHDVWIGQKALLMGGIKVGVGAIIGAGALVSKDIPPYAIVAGVPAKIIRYRFDFETREELLRSKWWDMPDNWLEENYLLFKNPKELINALNVD